MTELTNHIERWLDTGIITAEQAVLMRASCEPDTLPAAGGKASTERRVPVVVEIIGYVGAALAVWAVAILATEFWSNLTDWAQAGLFGAVAVAFFVAALPLLDSAEPAFLRLCAVLWAGSIVAVSGALFVVLDPIGGIDASWTWAIVGAIGSIAAGTMLRRQVGVVLHVMLFAAVVTTISALLTVAGDPESFFFGLSIWGIGLVWLLLARAGLLRPAGTGLVLGGMAMLSGLFTTSVGGSYEAIAVLLGLASAGSLAAAGAYMSEKLLIVVGGFGVFMYVPRAMFYFFGEAMGAIFGLFVTGLLLVAAAIGFARHRESK